MWQNLFWETLLVSQSFCLLHFFSGLGSDSLVAEPMPCSRAVALFLDLPRAETFSIRRFKYSDLGLEQAAASQAARDLHACV